MQRGRFAPENLRERLFAVALSTLLVASAATVGVAGNAAAVSSGGEPTSEAVSQTPGQLAPPANTTFHVTQAGQCYEVTPLGNGTTSVESFYDYRSVDSDPPNYYYSSYGTQELQENQVSQLFVYNGSNGYSLVALHDELDEAGRTGDGASTITFDISGLPTDSEWVVQDDYYLNGSQDDEWDRSGSTASVDWKWASHRSDGGALSNVGDANVTIDPGFNEAADAWGEWPHSGDAGNRTEAWKLVSGDRSKTDLNMTESLTVSAGPCNVEEPTPNPFDATTGDASLVSSTAATLNGNLSLGDNDNATVYFKYWVEGQPDQPYWWTGSTRTEPGAFSGRVGLSANTTYAYQALAQSDDGEWTTGTVRTVTTPETIGFDADTGGATNVTASGATLDGNLTLGDKRNATVYVKYWAEGQPDQPYWWTGSTRTESGPFDARVSLSANTTYTYRALARSGDGEWTTGETRQTTTLRDAQFDVTADDATNVTASGATLNGNLSLGSNDDATVYFKYWVEGQPDQPYWWTGSTRTESGAFSGRVGLSSNTTYAYQALAQRGDGEWTTSDTRQVRTDANETASQSVERTAPGRSVSRNATDGSPGVQNPPGRSVSRNATDGSPASPGGDGGDAGEPPAANAR